jgi:hypothetical protein
MASKMVRSGADNARTATRCGIVDANVNAERTGRRGLQHTASRAMPPLFGDHVFEVHPWVSLPLPFPHDPGIRAAWGITTALNRDPCWRRMPAFRSPQYPSQPPNFLIVRGEVQNPDIDDHPRRCPQHPRDSRNECAPKNWRRGVPWLHQAQQPRCRRSLSRGLHRRTGGDCRPHGPAGRPPEPEKECPTPTESISGRIARLAPNDHSESVAALGPLGQRRIGGMLKESQEVKVSPSESKAIDSSVSTPAPDVLTCAVDSRFSGI